MSKKYLLWKCEVCHGLTTTKYGQPPPPMHCQSIYVKPESYEITEDHWCEFEKQPNCELCGDPIFPNTGIYIQYKDLWFHALPCYDDAISEGMFYPKDFVRFSAIQLEAGCERYHRMKNEGLL